MGTIAAVLAIGSLVIGQTIPTTVYIQKDAKLPGSYTIKNLPKQYHAYTISTGDKSILSMLPMMFQSVSPSGENANLRLIDLFTVSYTSGETVVFEGADYLVAYVPNPSNLARLPGSSLTDIQLDLTYIRKDRIISYGPREDLDPEKLVSTNAGMEDRKFSSDDRLSNLKQLGLSFALYSSDADDVIPATESTADAQEVTFPYIDKAERWRTQNPNGGRILFNTRLAGISQTAIEKPDETILLLDEKPWPDGRRAVCYVDGHAAFLTEPEYRQRIMVRFPNFPRKMIKITGKRSFPTTVLKESPAAPPPSR